MPDDAAGRVDLLDLDLRRLAAPARRTAPCSSSGRPRRRSRSAGPRLRGLVRGRSARDGRNAHAQRHDGAERDPPRLFLSSRLLARVADAWRGGDWITERRAVSGQTRMPSLPAFHAAVNASRPRRASSPAGRPTATLRSRSRRCRRRRRSRGRTARASRPRRARRGSAGTSATPSPGSTRSAHPRVGSRQSLDVDAGEAARRGRGCRRAAWRRSRGARRRTDPERRRRRPRPSARPPRGSWSGSSSPRPPIRWIRLERRRARPPPRPRGRSVRRPSTTIRCASSGIEPRPRAGQADDARGSNARQPADRRAHAPRCARAGRPARHERQRQDRRDRRDAVRDLEPALAGRARGSRRRRPAGSFISQMPIPSTPAAA